MAKKRRRSVKLETTLGTVSAPIYVVDDRRRFVYFSPACAAWLGCDPSELLGSECKYHTGEGQSDLELICAALCPPLESFEGAGQSTWLQVPRAAGAADIRRARFLPLPGSAGDTVAVLVLVDVEPTAGALVNASRIDPGRNEQPASEPEAARLHSLLWRYRTAQAGRYHSGRLVGDSVAMRQLRAQIALAARGPANVAIVGPRGSGRKYAARAIHYHHGAAGAGTLVPIECDLVEGSNVTLALGRLLRKSGSESDVTSVATPSAGSLASAGTVRKIDTLLLADVDRLSNETQAELAMLLAGGDLPIRIIATTEQPLLASVVQAGHFRSDLASMLETMVLRIPPLRTRTDDLPLLAQSLVEEVNGESQRQRAGLTSEAIDRLLEYDWPGDVAQLAEAVRTAHAAAGGTQITAADLPRWLEHAREAALFPVQQAQPVDLDALLAELETEVIQRALERASGNKSQAAKLLGLTRAKLYRRLVQLGLEQPHFTPEAGADSGNDED